MLGALAALEGACDPATHARLVGDCVQCGRVPQALDASGGAVEGGACVVTGASKGARAPTPTPAVPVGPLAHAHAGKQFNHSRWSSGLRMCDTDSRADEQGRAMCSRGTEQTRSHRT